MQSCCLKYGDRVATLWSAAESVIIDSLSEHKENSVRLHAIRSLEGLAESGAELPHGWWAHLLGTILVDMATDCFHPVRASTMSILSHFSDEVLKSLQPSVSQHVSWMLLKGLRDPENSVRLAALSSLETLLGTQRNLTCYDQVLQEVLKGCDDKQPASVRARSLSAIACAVENTDHLNNCVEAVYEAALSGLACKRDNVIVMPCAIRVGGALLSKQLLDATRERNVLEKIAAVASDNAQHVKPRWNACHALSSFRSVQRWSDTSLALTAACAALAKTNNFKVATTAARALFEIVGRTLNDESEKQTAFHLYPCCVALLLTTERLTSNSFGHVSPSVSHYKESLRVALADLIVLLLQTFTGPNLHELAKYLHCELKEPGAYCEGIKPLILKGIGVPDFAVSMLNRDDEIGREARRLWRDVGEGCRKVYSNYLVLTRQIETLQAG